MYPLVRCSMPVAVRSHRDEIDRILLATYEYLLDRLDHPINDYDPQNVGDSRVLLVRFPLGQGVNAGKIRKEANRSLKYCQGRINPEAVDLKINASNEAMDVQFIVDAKKAMVRLGLEKQFTSLLDKSGVFGSLRVPYRNLFKELVALIGTYKAKALDLQIQGAIGHPNYAKLDSAIVEKIKRLVLQSLLLKRQQEAF